MGESNSHQSVDSEFTLDAALLAQRRAAAVLRMNTAQIPAVRALGFAILCLVAVLNDLRAGGDFPRPDLLGLIAFNAAYVAVSWAALRHGYGRTGRFDLGLVFLHLDVLAWLPNLHHLERSDFFFGYFLLMRVADQVGYGFRRALYFGAVVVAGYLLYTGWTALFDAEHLRLGDRAIIALTLGLLGAYMASIGAVTERLRNRLRLAVRAARELVDRLEQKTSALQAQTLDLDHARRQAEQASVAKSQFLAVVSHEIRTPMNGILGAVELLLRSPLNDEQRQYLEAAQHSAVALLALIDDVLDLSRIEAGKLSLQPTQFDLRALVAETLEMMRAAARGKPVTLRSRLPDTLPQRVEGDPLRLRQLLVNLLHNAVKFTERGSVDLEISVLGETRDAMLLRVDISDTGIGIPPEKLDTVFDAFTQADSSSTRRYGGSGLGLAIVKDLAELMGGQIKVRSRVGVGSTFSLQLTLMKVPDSAPPAPAPAAPAVGAVRVLLAEDDSVNQLIVSELLAGLGCEVDVVGDGLGVLEALGRKSYELVVMDCHMPTMDGYEATRRVRQRERVTGRHVPIVALTADALSGNRERCLEAGMDDYLTKPVQRAALGVVVARWVRRR